jgi:hypothetical protein
MPNIQLKDRIRQNIRSAGFWLQSLVLAGAGLLPVLAPSSVSAAQLTSRSVTIDKSSASATSVQNDFAFTLPSTTAVQGIRLQWCTTPLGTCTSPTGTGFTVASASVDGQSFSEATSFAEAGSADENDCTEATNSTREVCLERTDTDAETAAAKTLDLGTITLSNTAQSIYVRIDLYDENTFGSGDLIHSGVVAFAIVDQLTVNGRVQERLNFCVKAVDDGGATDTSLPASVTACAALSTTTIDIGTVDDSAIVKAPVTATATNGANDDYGIAMINTNAQGGVVLTYYPETAGSGTNELRSFRVTGASCNVSGTSLTDQCFVDASGSGETFAVDGTDQERFGLNIPCIDTSQGSTSALGSVPAAYSNTDATTTHDVDCENDDTGVKFAWSDSATPATLASSSGVVDDEITKLSFGALAHSTTPTGAYTVVSNYIATPTF